MKRVLTLLLSLLGIGSMGCSPSVEQEVAMYAAPYAEYHPSPLADVESGEVIADNEQNL